MKSDFEFVVNQFSRELDKINIYPIGDLHVGSPYMDEKVFGNWIQMVKNDPIGYFVIVGDMMDNALKRSKSNAYEATMSPRMQKEYLVEKLTPIKEKCLGAVNGNHCERSVVEADDCPLYDVMCRLGIEDLYRHNALYGKVSLGTKNKNRQVSYTYALSHGASRSRAQKYSLSLDGCDLFLSGHTHSPESTFPAKICLDAHNNKVYVKPSLNLVVPSFQMYGGYAVRALYTPNDSSHCPVITLSGQKKEFSLSWIAL